MYNGNLSVEGSESSGRDSRRVSLNQQGVRLDFFQDWIKTGKDLCGDTGQALAGFEDLQVRIWLDMEQLIELIQHFEMLTS